MVDPLRAEAAKGTGPPGQFRPGQIVVSRSNKLGPGKFSGSFGDEAQLDYFDSVARPRIVMSVPLASLRPFAVQPQTRCYWEANGEWRVGRVMGRFDAKYDVRAPNQ